MSRYQTITFRCKEEIFNRLEQFALKYGIDRTSAIKLALHYYLNLKSSTEPQAAEGGAEAGGGGRLDTGDIAQKAVAEARQQE